MGVLNPNISGNAETATLAANATKLVTASGSAPSYSVRAWVNFNGEGAVAIRGSGNVLSITDNGVGDYTVNIDIDMSNGNYAAIMSYSRDAGPGGASSMGECQVVDSGSVRVKTYDVALTDAYEVSLVVIQ